MLHPLRLVRIAIEAEALRLRHQSSRFATRVVFAAVAMTLLVFAVVFVHIALWYVLRERLNAQLTALSLAGADLLLAVVLGMLAARSSPGRIEREAHAVRKLAIDEAMQFFMFSALLARLLRLLKSRR